MEAETLPHNIAIEQAVISTLLNENNTYDKVSNILKPNDFFEKTHQIIFKNIINKLERGQVADHLTLMNSISAEGINPEYLISLSENPYPSENIIQYSELLVDLSIRRKLINFGKKLTEDAINHKNDIMDQVAYAEKVIFDLTEKTSTEGCGKFGPVSLELLKQTEKLMHSDKKISGINTGYNNLNEILGGFHPGQLIILAARPSAGKTAFSLNLSLNATMASQGGGPVLFISLEMPQDQICARLISSLARVPLGNILYARMTQTMFNECVASIQRVQDLPIYIYDYPHATTGSILSLLRQTKRQYNIGMVVVDYLQLIDSSSRSENREQELSRISRALKLMAKEIKVPILVLSQMSRDVEKRSKETTSEPRLSDLRGSGAIEQDADVVMFLYRQNENDRTKVNVAIAKNRNGPLGNFVFNFEGMFTTFSEIIENNNYK